MCKLQILIIVLGSLFAQFNYAHSQNVHRKTEVLIFGTTHLQRLDSFKPAMIEKVITRLESYEFDVIGIEKMSGELLNDILSREDSAYDGITKGRYGSHYLELSKRVLLELDISYVEAESNVRQLTNQSKLSISERKNLILYLIALTDIPSATLQYKRYGDGLNFETELEKEIEKILVTNLDSANEYYSLSMEVAYREGLNRLLPIDNLQDESLLFKLYPTFIEDYKKNTAKFAAISNLPVYQYINQLTDKGIADGDLSNLFEYLNGIDYQQQDKEAQWDIWLETNFSSGSDRARYSLWEMRNFQITANIMKVVAENPGKRVLIIIGSAHKMFIERNLSKLDHVKVLNY